MRRAIVLSPFAFTPPAVPGSIDIRATGVAYAQLTAPTSFGGDWDRSYPVATTAVNRVVGMRFQANIPKNATITSATLTTYSTQNATWAAPADNRTLGAEQADTTASATSAANAATLSANVGTTHTWSNAGSILNGQPIVTGDLSAVIQQIVNRAGWVSGNFITLWSNHPGNGSAGHQMWSVVSVASSLQPRLEVGYTA